MSDQWFLPVWREGHEYRGMVNRGYRELKMSEQELPKGVVKCVKCSVLYVGDDCPVCIRREIDRIHEVEV